MCLSACRAVSLSVGSGGESCESCQSCESCDDAAVARHWTRHAGFTRYNVLALLLVVLSGFRWDSLYAVATCTTWASCVSFHAALVFDPTAFLRLAEKMGVRVDAFVLGHLVAHVLPCLLTAAVPPACVTLAHGAAAAALHLAWGSAVSDGTMCLDAVYVRMPRRAWVSMWLICVATELATPLALPHARGGRGGLGGGRGGLGGGV